MHSAATSARKIAGFTLLELVFVTAVLAVLARVAMTKWVQPASLTVQAQAHVLADTVRRAQSLAMVRGQRTRVDVTAGVNGSVAVACAASGACTNTNASVSASQQVSVGSMGSVYFNSLGQPVDSTGLPLAADASFTVSYSPGGSFTVTVTALSGRVSVSP